MNKTISKILVVLTIPFLMPLLTFGQSTKKETKEVELDLSAERKVSIWKDSLKGTWELLRTVRYENGDTIIQAPSIQLWLTPGAKPSTIIRIDALSNFEIEQACMKCPYLFWKGQLEIETRILHGIPFSYLSFIDHRVKGMKSKKRKKAFTLEFNGYLTHSEKREITLRDKEGREWIYKRHYTNNN